MTTSPPTPEIRLVLMGAEHLPDGSDWRNIHIERPSWTRIEAEIRRMDRCSWPGFRLYHTDQTSTVKNLEIAGGNGEFYLCYEIDFATQQYYRSRRFPDPMPSQEKVRRTKLAFYGPFL